MSTHTNRAGLVCAVAALAVGASCSKHAPQEIPAAAAETPQNTARNVDHGVESPPGKSGASVRAYIDPATGQLREPTPEDIAAEAAAETLRNKATGTAVSKPSEPREVLLPSGAVMIELSESAQQPLFGCVQKEGAIKMEHDCASNPRERNR